jgi:NADH:ubiquinone oxidoreductase subunit D
MTEILMLSERSCRVSIIKMFQQAITTMPEKNEKLDSLAKKQKILKRTNGYQKNLNIIATIQKPMGEFNNRVEGGRKGGMNSHKILKSTWATIIHTAMEG